MVNPKESHIDKIKGLHTPYKIDETPLTSIGYEWNHILSNTYYGYTICLWLGLRLYVPGWVGVKMLI